MKNLKSTYVLTYAYTNKYERYLIETNNIRELLLKHKEEQDKSKEIVGKYWEQPNIVFTNEIGKFYDSSKVNRELKKILAKNNLKK